MSDELEIDFKELSKHKLFWPIIIGILFLITRLPVINTYQAFWWDEAQYLVMTKSLFMNTPTTGWWSGRSIIYPWMLRVISFPGFSELGIKLINILFGLGFVISSYYLIKELISKEKAILGSLIIISHWVFLYWSLRITIDVPSAFLLALSGYLFIKGEKNEKLNLLSGVVLGIAFNIRFTAAITGIIYLVYNLLTKKKLQDYYWLLGVMIGLMPLITYDLMVHGNPLHTPFSFLSFNLESSGGSQAGDELYYLSQMLFNYGVLMGATVFIGLIPLIFKLKNKKVLFIFLNVITYLMSYSLFTKVKEVRFLIHLLPFITITSLLGASLILKSFIKDKKQLRNALILFTIIILVENLPQGYTSMESVSDSYLEVKNAGEFLKDYEGNVMSNSVPQITYYSELETHAFPENKTRFLEQVSNFTFVIVSAFEQHPRYAYLLNQSFLQPIKAYPTIKKPTLIIYYVNQSLL